MRRTLIIGFTVGSLLGLGAATVSAEQNSHEQLPREKEQAVEAHQTVPSISEQRGKAPDWHAGRADSGRPSDVTQLKNAVALMLDMELDAGAMPRPVAQRLTTADERERRASRTAERIWVAESLGARRAELLHAIKSVESDSTYLSYTAARFIISDWQGVTVTNTTAEVTILGHETYYAPGEGWTRGPESQLQIRLLRISPGRDGWRLLDKKVLFDQAEDN